MEQNFDLDRPDLSVGVVGTGTMGQGIVQVAATAGCRVLIFDSREHAAAEAKKSIKAILERLTEKRKITDSAAHATLERIAIASSLSELSHCDVVVEAIVEDLKAKRALFAELDRIVADRCILATNTSSLSITEIASACSQPGRVAGLHFFNPVPLMRLVEVVHGIRTNTRVSEALVRLGEKFGKYVVRAKDTPGFLVNHVGRAYMPEALRILAENITSAEDVDRVMRDSAGFRMGPIELLDLVGVDVAHPVMEAIYKQYYEEPMYRPSTLTRAHLAAGLLGRKSGEGFYRYQEGQRLSTPEDTPSAALPTSVWVSHRFAPGRDNVLSVLEGLATRLESGPTPSSDALCIVTPVGADATSTILEEQLDPARTVAIDTIFDMAKRCTIMTTPATATAYRGAAHSLFVSANRAVTVINDSPGFIAQRIVAMIVNVACKIAQQGIASPANIDLGARFGLNYPMGPLELGDKLGARTVLHILESLYTFYGESRYRPVAWLKRRALLGLPLSSAEVAQ